MIEQLKPHAEYRESVHPWLGEVPAHWREERAKCFYREVDERSTTGEEELMSVSHKTGVTPRKAHVTMFKAKSNVGHKVCRPDDLVINTMWAFMAALGVARQVGIVSPSYGVYRPSQQTKLHSDYVDRLLRIEDYKSEYLCRSTGIRSSRLRLYPDQFLRIPILCPPPEEQAAIVRFLDHVDRRIRRYVRAKQQFIALLEEQKQAIIHRAVTRGVDPNVRLKPSGVEWLGDVPKDWQTTTLGRITKTFKTGPFGSILHQSDYISDGIPVVNPVHMKGGRIVPAPDCTVVRETAERLRNYELCEDDVVFSRRGELGRCALVHKSESGWLCGTGSIRVRLVPDRVDPEFLITILQAKRVGEYLSMMSVGATMESLNTGILKRLPLVLPPRSEQPRIADRIQKETRKADEATADIEQKIELVREYRTRLYADVVTGKLDVREAAVRLPDEVDCEGAVADELIEGEDVTADAELDVEPEEVEA